METIAQEAKRLLEPIPEDKTISVYLACKRIELHNSVIDFLYKQPGHVFTLWGVFNGKHKRYPQPTPKQRVMALLDDMIAAGY